MFGNDVESPLESVKEYIENFKTSFTDFDEHMSSVDLNLFGLIYYWDAAHKLNNYESYNHTEIFRNDRIHILHRPEFQAQFFRRQLHQSNKFRLYTGHCL